VLRVLRQDQAAVTARPERAALGFVVPVLDEAGTIERSLGPLASRLREDEEIVVVDGGSKDGTPGIARSLGPRVRVIEAPRGRAAQMNAGARASSGRLLVFAHADTRIPPLALDELRSIADREGTRWGFFPIRLEERGAALRVIETGVRFRVLVGGAATGDQAIFVRRDVFFALGGYPEIPLMEDVELSRKLGRLWRPVRPSTPIFTSARRWTRKGIVRTQIGMWALRLAWRAGVSPEKLAAYYPNVR